MSSIPYSGGTIVNTTFTTTTGTRQEIVTAMETQLTNAGWTVISGSGTGTVLLESATTASPKSNVIRVQLLEVGSGNCAQVKIQNTAGTLTSQAHFLLPAAGKTFRIIACKYNFFVKTAGAPAAREFVCGGTLHIPTNLETINTGSLGWIQGNAISDTDTTNVNAFTKYLFNQGFNSVNGRSAQIRNGVLMQDTGGMTPGGGQQLVAPSCSGITDYNGHVYRWADDALVVREAMLAFGNSAITGEAKIQGMIHNCMVISESFSIDDTTITSYDGHAWFGLTNNNAGATWGARGTLFVAVS